LLALAGAVVLLAACAPAPLHDPTRRAWTLADLRVLLPPDQPDPNYDLIAAYARQSGADLELRFDLLGSPDPYSYDMVLLLDVQPGGLERTPWGAPAGRAWDLALHYPARGAPRAFWSDGTPANLRPRILRLSVQDAAVARIRIADLPGGRRPGVLWFQAFLLVAGELGWREADRLPALALDGVAPSITPARLHILFWDSYPSATPVQAMRRWSSAHTGPYGQRHGLRELLQAASAARVPLALLDLKTPDSLRALDASATLGQIREMQRTGLLLLPDVASPDPHARSILRRFGIAPSPTPWSGVRPYGVAPDPPAWSGDRLPDPSAWAEAEVSPEGLSTPVRTALLATALSADSADGLALGGSLPASPWGDSLIAGPAFDFIAGHPWIQAAAPARRAAARGSAGQPAPAPGSLFTRLAWETQARLEAPAAPGLMALRAAYRGQVAYLHAAAAWDAAPSHLAHCDSDLDGNGAPECLLASPDIFLVIDPQGGRVALAVSRILGQPAQIIGPRSQMAVGLGDPAEWNPGVGPASDPQEIPGAFVTAGDVATQYEAQAQPDGIRLNHPASGVEKTFTLLPDGFQVAIHSNTPVQTQLPLLLLDDASQRPGAWLRYTGAWEGDAWTWRAENGPVVTVSAHDAAMDPSTFTAGLPLLGRAEDPNTALPPGATLPFPLAVLAIDAPGSFTITLHVRP
jgi:hypothetical protein